MLWDALTLQTGYNATLVAIGAALLGAGAGIAGVFLFLQKRALVSDAISHATLPGLCLAFLGLGALGLDTRSLPALLIGAAASAGLGLLCLQWLVANTRLGEDAAIGAVLSVFFGFGVVLLTVIQSLQIGGQAGLEGFLLGATAGMLRQEAWMLAGASTLVLALVLLLRRPMTLATFDPGYAEARGMPSQRIKLAMMGIVLLVIVVGMKIVGLILIVALLIIPPATARFWTDDANRLIAISALAGAVPAYLGAAVSAGAQGLPTGPLIVLFSFALFVASLIASPKRGALSAVLRHRAFQRDVHLRQGLLALAQNQPIYERLTLRLLMRAGLARADGVATDTGRAAAARALRDEHRWAAIRHDASLAHAADQYDGLTGIETVLTQDQITEIDTRIEKAVAL